MHVASVFAPSKGFQDSLGFWIPCCGFQVLDSGSFPVKLEFQFPIVSGIPDSLNCIPDSKALDSGFQKQKYPRFRNPDSLTWGNLSCLYYLSSLYFEEIWETINSSTTDDWNEGHPFKDRINISLFVIYAKSRRCGFKAGIISFYNFLSWVSFLFAVVALFFPLIQHGYSPSG